MHSRENLPYTVEPAVRVTLAGADTVSEEVETIKSI